MAEKVEKLGVNRDKDFMYYVKDSAVWKVQRKQPGVQKGKPEKVQDGTFQMDSDFIYFVDKDGDVSRAKRAVGGQKRKKTTSPAKPRAAVKKAGPASATSKGRAASKAKGRTKPPSASRSPIGKLTSRGAKAKTGGKSGGKKVVKPGKGKGLKGGKKKR